MSERTMSCPEASPSEAWPANRPDVKSGPVAPVTRRPSGLVLSRRRDQAIVIAGVVEILVAEIRANAVRLKITAPRSIPVHRREVYDSIRNAPRPPRSLEPLTPRRPTPGVSPGGLVLSRHAGEEIMIGHEIRLEVTEIRPQAIKLRITAPREVSVHRREIHEAILRGDGAQPGAGDVAAP